MTDENIVRHSVRSLRLSNKGRLRLSRHFQEALRAR
jgi:hypothetical protein